MSDKIFEWLYSTYGLTGLAIAIILFIFTKVKNPIELVKQVFSWFKSNNVHYSPREVLLSKLDYWINFKISNITMNDKGRQMLFRDILSLKFESFRNFVDEVSKSINEDMVGQEVYHVVMQKFNDTILQYENEARNRGIPDVVMIKFSEWQLRSYEFTLRSSEMICMSHGYGSNEARLQAVFSIVTAMMELTIAEAEKTLTELNGDLTGMTYKGVVCG